MPQKPSKPEPEAGQEFLRQLKDLGDQFASVLGEFAEDVQQRVDTETARLLSKHPELYAEIKKTLRQVKRTVDKAIESFGPK